MTRAEHLAWAKQRALEYVDRGELGYAIASMFSDLGKHPELQYDPQRLEGLLCSDEAGVRAWIESFEDIYVPVSIEANQQ